MRIGFDGTPLQYFRSGVGTYVEQLLHHLPLAHPEWEYLLYTNKPVKVNGLPRINPVTGYFPHSRWLWMQFKLPSIIPKSNLDICHFMNNSAPLRCPAPYAITIYDASLFLYSQYHPRSRLLALRLLLPKVARRAKAVITISEASRQDLINILRLPPEKVHMIHIAASRDFKPVQDPEQRVHLQQKYDLPSRFVLFVGTIEPRKNLLRLIAAFGQTQRDHPDCHLVLVGPEGWLMNGALAKETAAADLTGKVHYLGIVPQADLPGIYSLATLFAFPSLYEGFGLPLLEAMACGTPVLTSNCSAMPEVSGAAAYLVDPNSVASIAEGLNHLLDSRARREWFVEQGLARARQFSWERTAQQTAVIYEQIRADQS